MALAEFLTDEGQLELDDETFIESHILMTPLAYRFWKYGQQKKRDGLASGDSLESA